MIDLTTFTQVVYLLCGVAAVLATMHECQDADDSLGWRLLVYVLVFAAWPAYMVYCVIAASLATDHYSARSAQQYRSLSSRELSGRRYKND